MSPSTAESAVINGMAHRQINFTDRQEYGVRFGRNESVQMQLIMKIALIMER